MDSTHPSPPSSTYPHPVGRWESLMAVGASGVRDGAPTVTANALRQQNHAGGFAWANPAKPHLAQMCEYSAQTQVSVPLASGDTADPTVLRLMALRSDDQCNTTAHGMEERFRHIWDTRKLLFMHPHDMVARGLVEGDLAHVTTVSSDQYRRELAGMRVVPYDLPRGSVGGYFPECNALRPVQHPAHMRHLSAVRNIPVRVKSATA